MSQQNLLAERFEANRGHLKAVAYRMLGSAAEAEDAVQEAWLRLSRSDEASIDNIGGWLTTVVARICLDMLRSRKAKREDALEEQAAAAPAASSTTQAVDPEHETLLADSVGLALLIVLQTLQPAERVAFVLHDMFDIPFDEIAPVLGRTTDATRQLASRARRRVRGADATPHPNRARHREIVEAFLAAARGGDFNALLAVLDPEVVFRADAAAVLAGGSTEMRGAPAVAKFFQGRAQGARPMLIGGEVGAVVAPRGRLFLALNFRIADGRITEISVTADPEGLDQLDLAVIDEG